MDFRTGKRLMNDSRILIFEPESNGHQMNYVRFLMNGIREHVRNACFTLLTTEEATEHSNYRGLVADFPDILDVRVAPAVTEENRLFRALGSFYERQWKHAEAFARGFEKIGPANVDFALLPHLEAVGLLHLALRRGLFRGTPWATNSHAIRFHHRKSGIEGPFRAIDLLQRGFFWRVVNDPDLVCLGTNDPYLPGAVDHPKVVFCPDPCAMPRLAGMAEARAAYGIRPETRVVLVFGFIDRRKCVDVLLEGVARLDPDVDVTVLMAGQQHAGHLGAVMNGPVARALRERGRLIEVNRFIQFDREIDPMSAADISWVFYERDFVRFSNVLALSGLARRPVIARHQGLVGRMVEDNRLGIALASDAPDAIAAALTRLALDDVGRQSMGENGARFFAANTPANFARPIADAINRALSRKRLPA
jgi:glycosyltransferase involved in cell wall biosynthesis